MYNSQINSKKLPSNLKYKVTTNGSTNKIPIQINKFPIIGP